MKKQTVLFLSMTKRGNYNVVMKKKNSVNNYFVIDKNNIDNYNIIRITNDDIIKRNNRIALNKEINKIECDQYSLKKYISKKLLEIQMINNFKKEFENILSSTQLENAISFLINWECGESGYVGGKFSYGLSNSAKKCKNNGLLTLSELPNSLKKLVKLQKVISNEWHHTGYFKGKMNKTYFYRKEDFLN